MPSWLVEDPLPVYLLLGAAALILAFLWWTTRLAKYLSALGVVAALAGLVWLLDFLVVTDGEQIAQNIETMARGVNERNLDLTFGCVADDLRRGPLTKPGLRQLADRALAGEGVTSMKVWDLTVADVSRQTKTGKAAFSAKFRGRLVQGEYFNVRAEFSLEPDGQWRLKSFEVFNPVVNSSQPLEIPSF
jgi:hypothetical protein